MKTPILILLAGAALAQAQDESLTDQILRLQKQAFQSMQQSMSSSGTSLSLQESGDRYTVKLTLLNRLAEEIEVEYAEGRLILSAPEVEGSAAYRQEIPLPHAAPEAKPTIERKGSTVVVTVARDPAAPATAPGLTDDALARVQQMQQQMDAVFRNFFGDDADPFSSIFKKKGANFRLQEEVGAYVVTASVPAGMAENMDITIKDGKLLLEAKGEHSATPTLGIRTGTSWSDSFVLPGPVDASGVTVQRRKDNLIIRLPKADAA